MGLRWGRCRCAVRPAIAGIFACVALSLRLPAKGVVQSVLELHCNGIHERLAIPDVLAAELHATRVVRAGAGGARQRQSAAQWPCLSGALNAARSRFAFQVASVFSLRLLAFLEIAACARKHKIPSTIGSSASNRSFMVDVHIVG